MGTYVKTTGDLVTVRPKKTSAANQGRMLLDDALIEMLDIMLPVGELKTFSTDQVDSWIAKMAEYGQEWMVPEGQLLKVADYPELFALIGYNYGWSDANPNTTYTYTFTDVNGESKSLTLYNDLDIDGNAKAVSGSPAYFRLPNYSGRFLRCAGTATYANKWTDTNGNERQLLTTYTAKMYKGKLDAQRGISGKLYNMLAWQHFPAGEGVFYKMTSSDGYYSHIGEGPYTFIQKTVLFESSGDTPVMQENIPTSSITHGIMRVL